MKRFQNKVAIVTGGARGIGEQVAADFVTEGGRVAIVDMNAQLGTELESKLGKDVSIFIPTDVRDEHQCAKAVDTTWMRFGSLDFLVNSAIAINGGTLIELSLLKWQTTIDVGLTGTFLMGQAFARRMIAEGKHGAVVNLSSVSAYHPYAGSGAYSTVKAGILHLTTLMAVEWAPNGIRVNTVAPGTVETPLTAYLRDPEVRKLRAAAAPLGRVGQPNDVSPAVLYFLSEDASWVTAATLEVDGGLNKSLMNNLPGRYWSS